MLPAVSLCHYKTAISALKPQMDIQHLKYIMLLVSHRLLVWNLPRLLILIIH